MSRSTVLYALAVVAVIFSLAATVLHGRAMEHRLERKLERKNSVLITSMQQTISQNVAALAQVQNSMQATLLKFHDDATYDIAGLPPFSDEALAGFTSTRHLDCKTYMTRRTAVIVVAGQSNAGNSGELGHPNRRGPTIGQYWNRGCSDAFEPLMGAVGSGGSPWIRLAEKLLESGRWDRILLVPVSVGGTGMGRWRSGGDLHAMLRNTLRDHRNDGLYVSYVLWVQGEADRGENARFRQDRTSYLDGLQDLANLVFRLSTAPIYVALTSSCSHDGIKEKPALEIRAAQEQVVAENIGRALQGPDLDAISAGNERFDACHLTSIGLEHFATAWAAILASDPTTGLALK